MSTTNQIELSEPPTDAISAVRFAPNTSTRLLVSAWDKQVYLYDTQGGSGSGQLVRKFEHRAPVLDVCFGEDDNVAYSGGLDWDVRRIDLNTGEQTVLSSHKAAVKSLAYDAATHMLISASWDNTLHLHHPLKEPNTEAATLPLPKKPFALAVSPTNLVVAMAERLVHIYNLAGISTLAAQANQPAPNTVQLEPFQRRDSSLKFMTRALACMPNDAGYASSSIEGRVAVEWFDASAESQARKYAFKCHRQPATANPGADGASSNHQGAAAPAGGGGGGGGDQGAVDIVYPVHALAFHPQYGTFVSGGGDGVVALWDAVAKRRIRQYQRFPASVAALEFSRDGKYLAIGVSPGFEDGKEDLGDGSVKVYVRELSDTEAKGRPPK